MLGAEADQSRLERHRGGRYLLAGELPRFGKQRIEFSLVLIQLSRFPVSRSFRAAVLSSLALIPGANSLLAQPDGSGRMCETERDVHHCISGSRLIVMPFNLHPRKVAKLGRPAEARESCALLPTSGGTLMVAGGGWLVAEFDPQVVVAWRDLPAAGESSADSSASSSNHG